MEPVPDTSILLNTLAIELIAKGWFAESDVAYNSARVVVAALYHKGYSVIDKDALLNDLEVHADGNVGDGCWDLHDKWATALGKKG